MLEEAKNHWEVLVIYFQLYREFFEVSYSLLAQNEDNLEEERIIFYSQIEYFLWKYSTHIEILQEYQQSFLNPVQQVQVDSGNMEQILRDQEECFAHSQDFLWIVKVRSREEK